MKIVMIIRVAFFCVFLVKVGNFEKRPNMANIFLSAGNPPL